MKRLFPWWSRVEPAAPRRARPSIEVLEDRRLLAAPGVYIGDLKVPAGSAGLFVEGTHAIEIIGSNGADMVRVSSANDGENLFVSYATNLSWEDKFRLQNASVDDMIRDPQVRTVAFFTATVESITFRGLDDDDYFRNGTSKYTWAYGGAGADQMVGGFGVNRLYGEQGEDWLTSRTNTAAGVLYPTSKFHSELDGGGDQDRIDGSRFNDLIRGGGDKDRVQGNDGDDLIEGGDGIDWLNGGAGRDRIYGQAGRDIINGGDDPDLLDGGAAGDGDQIEGQGGGDTFVLHYGPGAPTQRLDDFNAAAGDQIVNVGVDNWLMSVNYRSFRQSVAGTSGFAATPTLSPILYEADFAPSLFATDPAALDPAADLLTAVDWNEVLAALDVLGAPATEEELMPAVEVAALELDASELPVEVLELDATLLEPELGADAGAWVFEVAAEPEAWAEERTPLDTEAALLVPEELASADDMLLLEAALAEDAALDDPAVIEIQEVYALDSFFTAWDW